MSLKDLLIRRVVIPTAMTSCTAAFTRNFRSVTPSITFTIMASHQVFSQDGEQRVRGEWAFSLSDELNRPVVTGTCHNSYFYEDLQLS